MKKLALAAGAALLAAAFAAPGIAQDAEKKEEKQVDRIIILDHAKGEHKDAKVRSFHIRSHDGKDGPHHAAMLAECGDDEKIELEEGDDKEKTKIFFCGKGMTAEERAKKLEELRGKLASGEHFSEEHRARMIESLERALERLRNTK